MGVTLYSKGPLKYYQADMGGLRVACWRILSLSLACLRRRSQRYFGKALLMPARMAMKWSLKVLISRLTALHQCTYGGISW